MSVPKPKTAPAFAGCSMLNDVGLNDAGRFYNALLGDTASQDQRNHFPYHPSR